MKGRSFRINGDLWTVVDVAPAAPLAEMVAALLEEEGFVTMTRGGDATSDVLTHLGTQSIGITYVLVPDADAGRALALIEETVTDFQGDDLEGLMEALATEERIEAAGPDGDDEAH